MPQKFAQIALLFLLANTARPQGRANDFRLGKISRDLITSPEFNFGGAEQHHTSHMRWLRVDVQFSAAPEFADELTFRYYILIAGRVLTGEVTHVNILAGRELYSSIYVAPHALAYLLHNRAASVNSVENIAIQIVQRGKVKDELSLVPGPAGWYKSFPAASGTGFVLNKNETPFAPLFWDHYEAIKPASH